MLEKSLVRFYFFLSEQVGVDVLRFYQFEISQKP